MKVLKLQGEIKQSYSSDNNSYSCNEEGRYDALLTQNVRFGNGLTIEFKSTNKPPKYQLAPVNQPKIEKRPIYLANNNRKQNTPKAVVADSRQSGSESSLDFNLQKRSYDTNKTVLSSQFKEDKSKRFNSNILTKM